MSSHATRPVLVRPADANHTAEVNPLPDFPEISAPISGGAPLAALPEPLTIPCPACGGDGYSVALLGRSGDGPEEEANECEHCNRTGRISAEPDWELIKAVTDAIDGQIEPKHAGGAISLDSWHQSGRFFQAVDFHRFRNETRSEQIERFVNSCFTGWPIDGSHPSLDFAKASLTERKVVHA